MFAAMDGVVGESMTDLEREWRRLAAAAPDPRTMDLWARIAPPHWIDRKRWRDEPRDDAVDAATALASDIDGVEGAEAATDSLRRALSHWSLEIPARIRWRSRYEDFAHTSRLLEPARRHAETKLSQTDYGAIAHDRASEQRARVTDFAHRTIPDQPVLVEALGEAAMVDELYRAAELDAAENPTVPLQTLWRHGYVLSSLDDDFVTLGFPRL